MLLKDHTMLLSDEELKVLSRNLAIISGRMIMYCAIINTKKCVNSQ